MPIRLRYKLEGYDNTWREGGGSMALVMRFLDLQGERVAQPQFGVGGDSSGWSGDLESSVLTHRREMLKVPPRASQLQIIITSAGPPATVGIYAVNDLTVSRLHSGNEPPEILLRPPFNDSGVDVTKSDHPAWVRDGVQLKMARIVELGRAPKTKALAILDDDPFGHAEWRTPKGIIPPVAPNDNLLLEWNELYSMGVGDNREARYENLPTGKYTFRVQEVSILGIPTGAEATLAISVPPPFWETPSVWAMLAVTTIAVLTASARYLAWHRMRRSFAKLEQQRVLERDRLRIAEDIHDDLGARVTQISLVSALAQSNAKSLEDARTEFERITRMSRDLVSALYETVWAVNPENDNLDSLGSFLCQRINEFCAQAQLRCRLHVVDLPQNIQISSQTRHNISLAVREAVHNIIKHAHASLVTVHVTFSESVLLISIQDDGCGFDVAGVSPGNGLVNLKRRLQAIGGSCLVASWPGSGTKVQMRLVINSSLENRPEESALSPPVAPAELRAQEMQPNHEKVGRSN